MRHPRAAVEGLVEVAVRLDEAGQHELAGDVDGLGGRRVDGRGDAVDAAVADEDVGRRVETPGTPAAEEHVGHASTLEPGTDDFRASPP
ncbi:hypothetical protein ABZ297_34980 [Nonomuraea sp. NPDC005983]|uniref:hypothetical protein n=1 Tax=Nonomuraea sp. NPDC005983 TaxID=3155595 RepID=UPI0033AD0496